MPTTAPTPPTTDRADRIADRLLRDPRVRLATPEELAQLGLSPDDVIPVLSAKGARVEASK